MDILILKALPEDLSRLSAVEAACFPPEEAAAPEVIRQRLTAFPDSFFAAEENGRIIGLVNGCVSDLPRIQDRLFEDVSLHQPDGRNQMVFSLAVDPEFQGRGVGGQLLNRLIAESRNSGRRAVILTCKPEKIGYYQRFGFRDFGVSASVHGGVVWHDMILEL